MFANTKLGNCYVRRKNSCLDDQRMILQLPNSLFEIRTQKLLSPTQAFFSLSRNSRTHSFQAKLAKLTLRRPLSLDCHSFPLSYCPSLTLILALAILKNILNYSILGKWRNAIVKSIVVEKKVYSTDLWKSPGMDTLLSDLLEQNMPRMSKTITDIPFAFRSNT